MGGFRRLGPVVAERFRDERLRRLFSFQAMYAGLPPSRALAIYAVITYMDSVAGVYFPEGGMGQIPLAMAKAAELGGVEFRWGATVQEIQRGPNGRVAAVDLGGGERLRADAVVCTLDTPVAYERLLPGLRGPRAVRSGRYSPSAVVWHVGVRGEAPADAAHHNIHFAHEWDSAFDALIGDLRLMPDPSRLVTVPSKTDASLAAPGGTTLYVLEPVPHLGGNVNWNTERGPMRERLMGFLQQHGYPTDVVTEELVTPLEWQAMGMASGTPFALAHTFFQTGPFRPPNVERRMPGLVFAGSSTVPGVGVPMVLISGKLAAERVRAYLPVGDRPAVVGAT
jgi:phytoene desaturase